MGTGGRLNEVELGAWVGFLRAHHTLVAELDDELRRAHGLPLTSFDVLAQLDNAPEHQLRMSELADAVLLSRSGLTRLVERLQSKVLIERRECTEDARGAFAVLTGEGEAVLDNARTTHLAGVRERFLERFDEEELRSLGALWRRVLARAGEKSAGRARHVGGVPCERAIDPVQAGLLQPHVLHVAAAARAHPVRGHALLP